jgi:hypothetical protein
MPTQSRFLLQVDPSADFFETAINMLESFFSEIKPFSGMRVRRDYYFQSVTETVCADARQLISAAGVDIQWSSYPQFDLD